MSEHVQDFIQEPGVFFLGIKPLNIKTVDAAKDNKALVIPVVARHLCREIEAEVLRANGRIDPSRTALNYSLLPALASSKDITDRAVAAMEEHGIAWKKKRKDTIMGVELVFSLPPSFAGDVRAYFKDCLGWVEKHFPRPIQMVAAMVHLDEAHPHVHIVLVPLIEHGRMSGHKIVGYKAVYNKRVNSFHREVAQQYGLRKPRRKGKWTYAERQQLADLIMATMVTQGWKGSAVTMKALRNTLTVDPLPTAQAMGLLELTAYAVDAGVFAGDEVASASEPTAYLCNAVDPGKEPDAGAHDGGGNDRDAAIAPAAGSGSPVKQPGMAGLIPVESSAVDIGQTAGAPAGPFAYADGQPAARGDSKTPSRIALRIARAANTGEADLRRMLRDLGIPRRLQGGDGGVRPGA